MSIAVHRATPQTSAPPRRRDPFIDAVRAAGTLGVVGLHWLMLDGAWDGSTLVMGNALASGPGWLMTWLVPLPLLFFAAGAAAAHGRRGSAVRAARRLVPPVGLFLAATAAGAVALLVAGVPGQAVGAVARTLPQPLWFLGVYLGLLALVPFARRALARYGAARVLGALAAAAVLADAVRFGAGVGPAGWANVLLVWAVPFVAGLASAASRPPRAVLVGGLAGALAAAAALVVVGPYPASMIGMPGAPVSNLNPPTTPVLLLAVAQVCAALLARDAVTPWAAGRGAAAVGWLAAHATTVYLWHLAAMFTVAGFVLVGLGERLPSPWSADWWASRPVWFGTMALVLGVLVRWTGWAERRGRAAGQRQAVASRSSASTMVYA